MVIVHEGPPYEDFQPRLLALLPYYVVIMTVGYILGTMLIVRGFRRQKKEPKILGLSFLFYGSAILWAFLGLLSAYQLGQFREFYRLSLPMGYSCSIFGNLCLLWFAREVFEIDEKVTALFAALFAVTLVLVNLKQNWYGTPGWWSSQQFSVRMYSSISLMLVSVLLYSYMIKAVWRLYRKVDDEEARVGMKLIASSLVCFIGLYVCFAVDAVNIQLGGGGWTLFVFYAWGFGAAFWILSYMGLTMPAWLKRRIARKKERKNGE
ncbi:MAG: hypothetical protein ACTSU5_08315 [Promethearchaeota archaeon]